MAEGPILFREQPVPAVFSRHPFARRKSVSMDDLARDRVLRPREFTGEVDALVVPRTTPGGRPIPRGLTFGTIQEMLALIGAGKGVFVVPAHARRYDSRPDVTYVPIQDGRPFEWRLVWSASARAPACARSRRILRMVECEVAGQLMLSTWARTTPYQHCPVTGLQVPTRCAAARSSTKRVTTSIPFSALIMIKSSSVQICRRSQSRPSSAWPAMVKWSSSARSRSSAVGQWAASHLP